MLAFLFDDRRRWTKMAVAVAVLAGLGVYGGVGVTFLRPSVLRYETRAEEFDGGYFSLHYVDVLSTADAHFTLDVRRGRGLRVTDRAGASAIRRPGVPHQPLRVAGRVVRPGDVISVRGVFRRPNLLVADEVRVHPRRRAKYLAAIPAFLAVAALVFWRLRASRAGIDFRRRGPKGSSDA